MKDAVPAILVCITLLCIVLAFEYRRETMHYKESYTTLQQSYNSEVKYNQELNESLALCENILAAQKPKHRIKVK